MPEAGRFPRTRWGSPGYVMSDVDEFVTRIEATLNGSAAPGQARPSWRATSAPRSSG